MRPKLLELYERELGYMRQLGAEFAAMYPAVAGRLMLEPDRCADPHVERLLEAFSFLSARIHLRLDDDFPELTDAFFDVVYPHYLRPVPSMTIVEFVPDAGASSASAGISVAAGSVLTSRRTLEGVPCTFRTGYPVTVWPVRVAQCSMRRVEQIAALPRVPNASAVLRLELHTTQDAEFTRIPLEDLTFYLSGDRAVTLPLYELLSRNLLDVLVRNPLEPKAGAVSLGRPSLQPMGFAADEALLPYTQRSFQGHRLLQEYFSFPEKFLFYRLSGLQAALAAVRATRQVEVLLFLRQPEQTERLHALEASVHADTIKLHCAPAINLFEQVAEPVVITQTRAEYPVTVDARNRVGNEVYSIESVYATNPSRRTSVRLPPLFEHRFEASAGEKNVYWRATRRYSQVQPEDPGRMYLSIVDAHGAMMQPNAEVLTLRCLCTNHTLPAALPVGDPEGDFRLADVSGIGRVQALHRPSAPCAAPTADGHAWSLISQLSLNHLSLGEEGLPALQEILRLHDFAQAPHLQKQISGLTSLQAKPHIAIMEGAFGTAAVRGTRVALELDESHFPSGTAFLFSAVLDRFFGLYVSMNSFSQLAVRTKTRKEALAEWPPRAGHQALL